MELKDISKERILEILQKYVNEDYDPSLHPCKIYPDVIRNQLTCACGVSKEEAKALGLEYIFRAADKLEKNMEYYSDADFIAIENGKIHWRGYFYDSCGWHILEYGGFYTSIEDFIVKYNRDPSTAYEEEGVNCAQYILYEYDDPEKYTIEWFQETLEDWLNDVTEIKPEDITLNMPDGEYVLIQD